MRIPERLRLIHSKSPITPMPEISYELGKNIYAWRDDLTEFIGSGNKLRKLEFLLADARTQNATRLVTCGGPQSNHTRATVYAARQIGLSVSLVIRGERPSENTSGNYFINRLLGADLSFVTMDDYRAAGSTYGPFLKRRADELRDLGERPYIIPEGGSCPIGSFGYMAAVEEMLSTWSNLASTSKHPDTIVCAIGSGGTLAGLQLGCQKFGVPTENLWAVNVCNDRAYFEQRVRDLLDRTCEEYGLDFPSRTVQILDGHVGAGYSLATEEELSFYTSVARTDGIVFDPCYTGKAFRGLVREVKQAPERFGKNILFLHSGGIFGNFAYLDQWSRIL